MAGVCLVPDTVQPGIAMLKEASVRFAMAYERRDFERTIELLERGRLDPTAMITERIGLDEVPAAA